ncbi:MAG: hypothetical protein PQJ59_12975 [Spirochaetales bacterium]|nr:hypothetical protein [Spirochaetales bacterium]
MIFSPRRARFFIIFLFFVALTLSAQSPLDGDAAEAVIGGTEKAARKMVSSVLNHRTHYAEGEFTYAFTPAVSFIDKVWSEPEVTGDRWTGVSLGNSVAYGLSDKLALIGTLALGASHGTLETDLYGDGTDIEGDVDFFIGQLYLGGSYEAIRRERFSLPLTLGFMGTGFFLELRPENYELDDSYEGTAYATLEASGFTPGMHGGASAEYRFKWVALKLNAAFLATFTGLSGESEVSLASTDGSTTTYSSDYTVSPYLLGLFGFSMELQRDKHWRFKLDVSDFLPLQNQDESAVNLYNLALTVSYLP